MRFACSLLAIALVLVACDQPDEDEPVAMTGASSGTDEIDEGDEIDDGPWTTLEQRPCPPQSTLTWENFGGPFVLTYCNGCHGSGLPVGERQGAPLMTEFDNVFAVRRQRERVWARAADDNDTMPPIGGAGPQERALLGEWLACGAPADGDLAD